ncbi:hypothetical protein Pst134EB_014545 [Puccinia striiformis f. sp. tritici]|nr:hypothetical protein Pst134EB_014545 [Puccinia striiformis f. sp. tritici]
MEAAELANLRIQQSYTKEKKIGEGTYASVYEGHQKKSNRKVAIKKIKAGQFKDGLDMSAIREVKFLQELSHPNVISLLDVFSSKSNLNLVLEFLDTDLEAVIKDRELVFQASDIKSWMLMTMQGLDFCHQNWVLHRDMKPNNLLIASDGTLKIADFGLAREYADPGTRMTCQVVTRSVLLEKRHINHLLKFTHQHETVCSLSWSLVGIARQNCSTVPEHTQLELIYGR